ncbi:MAG: lectin-like protein [Planctomycetota bacterium]
MAENRPHQSDDSEVLELARGLCEQSITEEERARLEVLLTTHPELRCDYLRYVGVHADLNWRYRANASEAASSGHLSESATPSSGRGQLGKGLMLFLAIAASVALFAAAVPFGSPSQPAADETGDQRPAYVATLTGATHAVWVGEGQAVNVGQRVETGLLKISEGEAELVFDSGARVLIAGPATLKIETPLSLFLKRGRVAAHMPPSAIGFEIRTPMSKLVDMGTEFGVQVDDSGQTEVMVFRGQVDLHYGAESESGETASKLAISDRQARMIKSPGTAGEPIEFSLDRFGPLARRVADPVEWEASEGGNGHFYQLVVQDEPLTWHEAAQDAMSRYYRGKPGHLATMTSPAEDQFVVQNLLAEVHTRGVWFGLTDVLREGHFRWVTGEPYEYTNWANWPNQQPDNFHEADWHGGEDYGMYTRLTDDRPWAWNDLSIDSMHEKISAYLIEFEPPVDALRHRSMSLDPIHWSEEMGGNGNYYRVVLVKEPTSWEAIRQRATETELFGVPGRLVVMESEEERRFVAEEILRVCGIPKMMIGLSGSLASNDLKWVNGQPVEGFEVERSHLPTDQVYGMFHWNPAGKWQTGWEIRAISSDVRPAGRFGYLVEYPVGDQ